MNHDDDDTEDEMLASQPHDAYFKDFFSDITHATAFFKSHLREDLATLVHWDSLALVPGSFVKRSLRQAHSDLLFSARADTGTDLLLYLVFEHQSSTDPAMPLRLLAYQSEILLAHHAKQGLPLPPVICYVLNQGPDKWTVSQQFEDLFQIPEKDQPALLQYIPKFRHALLDLTQIDPGRSEDEPQLRVALQLMKLSRTMQLLEFFQWLAPLLEERPANFPDSFLRKSLLYALHTDGDLDVEEIANTLKDSPNSKKTVMSIAEKLIAKGKAEGEAKGKARGEWYGKISLIEKLIGAETSQESVLAKLSLEQLESHFLMLESRYETTFKKQ